MATVIKRFFCCTASDNPNTVEGDFYFSLEPYMNPGWYVDPFYPTYPTGFAGLVDNDLSLVGIGLYNAPIGEYSMTIRATNDNGTTYEYFTLEFELSGACVTEIDNIQCCDDNVVLKWLGVEGGIKSWSFPGVREFDIKVGDAITFKNINRQIQYAQRKDIYTGKRITSGSITQDQVDFLDEVKYAIQVWESDGTTDTPILVDNDSFSKYKSTDKFFDISIQYIMSEEIQVQTQ